MIVIIAFCRKKVDLPPMFGLLDHVLSIFWVRLRNKAEQGFEEILPSQHPNSRAFPTYFQVIPYKRLILRRQCMLNHRMPATSDVRLDPRKKKMVGPEAT